MFSEHQASNHEHRQTNIETMTNDKNIYAKLNNGIKIPLLGLGVYDMYKKEAEDATNQALEVGYRLIDTASMYKNETEIGNVIRQSKIGRAHV